MNRRMRLSKVRLLSAAAAVGLLSSWVQHAPAATAYWDGNGATAGAGTAPVGTWGSSNFWSSSSAGTAATGSWNSGDVAVFSAGTDATATYTVNVSGTQTVSGISLEEGNVTLSGGALTLSKPGGATVSVNGPYALDIQTPVSGDALIKSFGSLYLSAANTFSNLIVTNAGILRIGNDGAFGTGTASLSTGASAPVIRGDGNNRTIANNLSLVGTGEVYIQPTGLGTKLAFTGTISGANGSLDVSSGTLQLDGDNTFGGGMRLSSATVILGHEHAAGTGTINVFSGGTLSFPGANQTLSNNIQCTSTASISSSGNVTLSGVISGGGTLRNTFGSSLLITNPSNTFTNLYCAGGTTTVDSTAALGSASGTLTLDSGRFAGGASPVNVSKSVVITPSAGTVSGGTVTFSGQVSGSGTLKVTGGTLDVTGSTNINWTGEVEINGGTLRLATFGMTDNTSLRLFNGSMVALGDIMFVNTGLNFFGATADKFIDTQGFTVRSLKGLGAGGTLGKKGTGTLELGTMATNVGQIIVNEGRINATADKALGNTTSGTLVKSGASLAFFVGSPTTAYTNAEPVTLEGGNANSDLALNGAFPGPVTLLGDAKIQSLGLSTLSGSINNNGFPVRLGPAAGDLHVTGAISGGGPVVKQWTLTLFLENINNSYSGGTTIEQGTVSVADDRNLGAAAGDIRLNGGGLITSAAVTSSRNVITGTANFNDGGTINSNGSSSSFGAVSGTAQLTKAGAGKITVTNVRIPTLNVSGGTVAIAPSGGQAVGTSKLTTLSLAAGGKLDLADGKLVLAGPDNVVGSWNGSAYTGTTGLIQLARGNSSWNGTRGITTSMTDATTGVLTSLAIARADEVGYAGGTFGGQSVAANDVLVMYTWGGDADLNGELNGDDYFWIDSHVPQSGSVFGFHYGDFDYDGDIDGDDYFILDSNILQAQASQPFPTGSPSGLGAVPEPGVLGLMVPLLLMRRGRAKRAASKLAG